MADRKPSQQLKSAERYSSETEHAVRAIGGLKCAFCKSLSAQSVGQVYRSSGDPS